MYTQFHIPTRKHIKFIPQKDTKKKKKIIRMFLILVVMCFSFSDKLFFFLINCKAQINKYISYI